MADGNKTASVRQSARNWRSEVQRVDLARVGRARRGEESFNEAVEAVGREEHQRVVPIPLAVIAVLLPFLAAWASAQPLPREASTTRVSEAVAWTERRPPSAFARERRLPEDPNGYVDFWAPAEPWELRLLERTR